jgi:hypothetical protein
MSREEHIAENDALCRDLNERKAEVDIEPSVEEVVKEYQHFWIVEKRGEAGTVAEQRG